VNARARPSGENAGFVSPSPSALDGGLVSLRCCCASTDTRDKPPPRPPEANAIHFESGVQARYGPGNVFKDVSSTSANTRSCPPRCGITISADFAEEICRRKAINCPSGDQAGLNSRTIVAVNRDGGSRPICLM
jgi:hypothetical protein